MEDLTGRALAHAAAERGRVRAGVRPGWVPTGPPGRTRSGLAVVHMRQTHGGIPVLGAVRSVRFRADGTIDRFTGTTVPVRTSAAFRPAIDARAAGYAAARHLGDVVLPELAPDLAARVSNRRPRVLHRAAGAEATTVMRKIPFRDPVTASLAVRGDGSALVWVVRFRVPGPHGSWTVLVDAEGDEPRVLDASRTSAHAVSALVFRQDPDAPPGAPQAPDRTEEPFPLPRERYPDFGGAVLSRTAWCTGRELSGNNARCEDSGGRTVRATVAGGARRFEPANPRGIDQAMVNAFYQVNRLHDFFYLLGFDESTGNFQEEADAAAGGGRDPVAVTVWDAELPGLAYFVNFNDGFVSELHLGKRAGRYAALDVGVVIHEYVHGVTGRIVGGPDVATPFRHPQSRALAEGYSDYFSLTLQNRDRREDGLPPVGVYGAWISGDPVRGLRNHAYDDAFPATYGKLGAADFDRAHDAGQIWCAALLELNRVLAHGGGPEVGEERGWSLVFDSLRLLHPGPEGPTFLHARDAVLAEFAAAVSAGLLPADPALDTAVRRCFSHRGMGPAALSPSAGYHGIVEDFDEP